LLMCILDWPRLCRGDHAVEFLSYLVLFLVPVQALIIFRPRDWGK
jgi:hypothetical protein